MFGDEVNPFAPANMDVKAEEEPLTSMVNEMLYLLSDG
jgi:hypothetical protein